MTRAMVMAPLALMVTLAGCGGGSTPAATRPATAGMRPARDLHRVDPANPFPVPAAHGNAGSLQGRDENALTRLFGSPRLDVHEGAAHKLQFANDVCVLDAYLYAPRQGAEPVVTHVDTRTREGEDVDIARCMSALQRR